MTIQNTQKNTNQITSSGDEKILKMWKLTNHITESTYKSYKVIINEYATACRQSIQQLYEEAILEEEERIPRHRKSIKLHVLEYMDYLDNQTSLAESTKNTRINTIKSFYKSFDIEVPNIKNNYNRAPDRRNVERKLNKEIIRLMVQKATTRDKAILTIAYTTGQAADEISHLTIQQFMDAWNYELETPVISVEDVFQKRKEILEIMAAPVRIERTKTHNQYWFYIPCETSRAVIDYLYERQAGNNTKLRIKDTTDKLFKSKYGKPMDRGAVSKVFTYVGTRCGFDTPDLFEPELQVLLRREPGMHRTWSAHHYRKYFFNTCKKYAGTRHDTRTSNNYTGLELADFFIGHSIQGSTANYVQYDKEDIEELRVHYLQALPYISIDTEIEKLTTHDKREFEEMKNNYDNIVSEMRELKQFLRDKEIVSQLAREYGLEK